MDSQQYLLPSSVWRKDYTADHGVDISFPVHETSFQIPIPAHPNRIYLPDLSSRPMINNEPPGYININPGCVVLYQPTGTASTPNPTANSTSARVPTRFYVPESQEQPSLASIRKILSAATTTRTSFRAESPSRAPLALLPVRGCYGKFFKPQNLPQPSSQPYFSKPYSSQPYTSPYSLPPGNPNLGAKDEEAHVIWTGPKPKTPLPPRPRTFNDSVRLLNILNAEFTSATCTSGAVGTLQKQAELFNMQMALFRYERKCFDEEIEEVKKEVDEIESSIISLFDRWREEAEEEMG